MKRLIKLMLFLPLLAVMAGCQKENRPPLGDYPTDEDKPPLLEGDLRFFVPFQENEQVRYQVADSISGDPAQTNPFSLAEGINGMGMQFSDAGKAVKYMTINDMNTATSLTFAFWMKNEDKGKTEFVFSMVDPTYSWSNSAAFLLLEHGNATETAFKFSLMDQWLEFPDANKFKKPLMDGNWHHLAIVYDQAISQMAYYFDGTRVTDVPASALNVKNGDAPRGALDLSKIKQLVMGGWNKHASVAGPTDSWISSYSGALDQFRIYNKALSAEEVKALYDAHN